MTRRSVMWVCVVFAAAVATTSAQTKDWKTELTTSLKSAYPNVKTATFEKNNITQPGLVLVVQKPSIMGEDVHDGIYRISTVEGGQVSAPKGIAGFLSAGNAREFEVGQKVYINDIDVLEDRVRLKLLSLEMYDMTIKGTTRHTRLVAMVDFKFGKSDLAGMSVDQVKAAIGQVLVDSSVASAPKSIALGQTMAEVEGVLGKPETVINLGAKVTYVYKNMKVIFTNGKVTDVQ
jgi:hypothetical protein